MTIAQVLAGEKRWHILTGKWQDVLTLPDRSVDHVITDPPYDKRTHKGARACAGSPSGVAFDSLDNVPEFVSESLRLARRWSISFCTFEMIAAYESAAKACWVRTGVWDRVNPSPQLTGDRPAQAADAVAIMHGTGRKRWNGHGLPAIWRHSAIQVDKPDHPTPKPLPLMLELVGLFTDPGDLILDPYCGSGTTGVACLRLGRRFIGCEMNAEWAQLARDRLAAEEQQSTLSAARAGQLPMFGR